MKIEAGAGESGFTLVEFIVVLVLLGIFSAVVSVRWRSAGAYTVRAQADWLAANIQHLQNLSSTQGRVLRLNIHPDRYCATLPPETDCAKAIKDPATSKPFHVVLADAVLLAGSSVDFDSLGRPVDSAGLLTTARKLQLTADTTTWSVILSPNTGFVSVAAP